MSTPELMGADVLRLLPRVLLVLSVVVATACLLCGVAEGQGEAKWRLVAAQAPSPPAGVPPAPYGVPLGVVGEISFWAPNRGLLITGGNEASGGSGLYAYDGVTWHQLSTVCGGSEGRIVWAGPDEFWTIADQRPAVGEGEAPAAASLCHFVGAAVVGSYAMPVHEPNSWVKMDSGACYGPGDCWFGGQDGISPNVGAFHLHWNGSTVTAVYEPEDHAVSSMASFQGRLFEAVQLEASDTRLPGEPSTPAVIHTIAPSGVQPIFGNLTLVSPATKKLLPEYGKEVLPEALQGFELATDAPAGATATQLWAAANPGPLPAGSKPASVTVLRDGPVGWSQVVPAAGGQTLPASMRLADRGAAIAPEPGSEDTWLSLRGEGGNAEVVLLEADGSVAQTDLLPEPGEDVGFSGRAGVITCPARHDCWMATFGEPAWRSGWLFHLTNGAPEAQNTDPLFDGADGVIAYRPPDGATSVVYTSGFAEDDSLANQQVIPAPVPPVKTRSRRVRGKPRPLVKDLKSRLVDHRTLVIAFTLTARARVQLIARRLRHVVARTPRDSMRRGRHTISLTLDPRLWPTKLQFEAKPIGPAASKGSEESSSSSGNVVGT